MLQRVNNETQHHSNDCYGWPYSTPFDQPNFIFSDEAHFHIRGYVNKQNCRICGSENPNVIIEKPMHPQQVLFGADFGTVA